MLDSAGLQGSDALALLLAEGGGPPLRSRRSQCSVGVWALIGSVFFRMRGGCWGTSGGGGGGGRCTTKSSRESELCSWTGPRSRRECARQSASVRLDRPDQSIIDRGRSCHRKSFHAGNTRACISNSPVTSTYPDRVPSLGRDPHLRDGEPIPPVGYKFGSRGAKMGLWSLVVAYQVGFRRAHTSGNDRNGALQRWDGMMGRVLLGAQLLQLSPLAYKGINQPDCIITTICIITDSFRGGCA